jgi:hypothetical protein
VCVFVFPYVVAKVIVFKNFNPVMIFFSSSSSSEPTKSRPYSSRALDIQKSSGLFMKVVTSWRIVESFRTLSRAPATIEYQLYESYLMRT